MKELDYLYHGGDRYREMMELIKATRGDENNA